MVAEAWTELGLDALLLLVVLVDSVKMRETFMTIFPLYSGRGSSGVAKSIHTYCSKQLTQTVKQSSRKIVTNHVKGYNES